MVRMILKTKPAVVSALAVQAVEAQGEPGLQLMMSESLSKRGLLEKFDRNDLLLLVFVFSCGGWG
jgi:hypothetical protein